MTSRRTKISPKTGRGLCHVTHTIFGSTVGYPSDSLAFCSYPIPTALCSVASVVEFGYFAINTLRILRTHTECLLPRRMTFFVLHTVATNMVRILFCCRH